MATHLSYEGIQKVISGSKVDESKKSEIQHNAKEVQSNWNKLRARMAGLR